MAPNPTCWCPDVDGQPGIETLDSFLECGLELPGTVEVITGSCGTHYYFAHAAELSNAVKFAPGLDVRTEGGFAIAPGSRNAKGDYGFRPDRRISDFAALPDAPDWLLALIRNYSSNRKGAHGKSPKDANKIPEGQRGNELYRLGRSLHARGLNFEEILATVAAVNMSRCEPPLDSDEVERIAHSAAEGKDRSQSEKGCKFEVAGDLAVADRMLAEHQDDMRYCPATGDYIWDGARWLLDERETLFRLGEAAVRKLYLVASQETDPDRRKQLIKAGAEPLEGRARQGRSPIRASACQCYCG